VSVDDVDQFLEQQEIGRHNTQACTERVSGRMCK
jgi:hypothetical protein